MNETPRNAFAAEGDGDVPKFLAGGGEMGRLMREHDWAATPLGAPSAWPQSLRTVLRLMLSSNHPMFVFWGERLVCFYNDAYSGSIGSEKHPAMLGAPGHEMWEEIWPIIGPQIDFVMASKGATWHENQLVPIIRHGGLEDVYWTYGFSPIDDELAPNGVGGVLVVCTETTQHVLAQRRQTFLVELGDKLRSLVDVQEIETTAAGMLGEELQADRVAYAAISMTKEMASSRQVWIREGGASRYEARQLASFGQELLAALKAGEAIAVDDVSADPRTVANRASFEAIDVSAFVSAPLIRNAGLVNSLTVQSSQPRHWRAKEVDLVKEVAERTWDAVARARAETTQKLLIEELNHRVRNTLAVVASIAAQTRRHSKSITDFGAAFEGRIQALAVTHTMLAEGRWERSGLHTLIRQQLRPFAQRDGALEISGPAVPFEPKQALALSLVLHELATNAAKFGALTATTGRIEIDWTVVDAGPEKTLHLRWAECGGPPVQTPTRIGFGTKLIDQNITYEFQGDVERKFEPEGLICRITIPLTEPKRREA